MRLIEALADMAAAFGGKADAERLAVYAERLADIEEHTVVDAINRLMLSRTDGWMPTIGEIRKEASLGGFALEGAAEMAWSEVQDQVRRVGWNRGRTFSNGKWHEPPSPVFKSPVTAEAVRSLTWKLICTGEQGDVREQFLWTWRHLSERMVKVGASSAGAMLPSGESKAIGEGE